MNEIDAFAVHHASLGISLGLQLICALALLVLTFGIHGAGVVGVTKLLELDPKKLRAHRINPAAFGLMLAIALSLLVLHLLEILVFTLFYIEVGAIKGFEAALYTSINAFTTLGNPDASFPRQWRIIAALEGLAGFLLIGWSTAIFVSDVNRLLRERPSGARRHHVVDSSE